MVGENQIGSAAIHQPQHIVVLRGVPVHEPVAPEQPDIAPLGHRLLNLGRFRLSIKVVILYFIGDSRRRQQSLDLQFVKPGDAQVKPMGIQLGPQRGQLLLI